jgi:hypothetical protein
MKALSHDCRFPGRDLDPERAEYEAEVRRSVLALTSCHKGAALVIMCDAVQQ